MPVVDELITLLGVETDSQSLRSMELFSKGMEKLERGANIAVGALTAASGALTAFLFQAAGADDEAGKFADSLGITVGQLKDLEFATQSSGGTIGELRGDLDRLTTQFAVLGGDAAQVLQQMAGHFEGLSAQQAKFIGEQLGLSESTIRLLRNGRDGLRELLQESQQLRSLLPEDSARQAAEFNDAWLRVKTAIGSVTDAVQLRFFPVFTNAFISIKNFILENRNALRNFLDTGVQGVIDGFSRFFEAVKSVGSAIGDLLPDFKGLQTDGEKVAFVSDLVYKGLIALTAIFIAFKLPLIASTAAITALLFILDDLITYFQGGRSKIGDFIEMFKTEFPFISEIVGAVFDKVVDFIETAFRRIKGVFNAFAEGGILEGLKAAGQLLIDYYVGLFDNMLQLVRSFAGKIGGAISGSVRDALGSVAGFFGFGDDEDGTRALSPTAGGRAGYTFRPQAIAPSAALTPGNVSSVTNNRGGDRTAHITVNGARDPRAVAQEVVRQGGLNTASQSLQPGTRAPNIS